MYLNCYKECEFNFYYEEINNKYHCTPDKNCLNPFDKEIPAKNQCVSDCKIDQDYPFEYKKKCYNKCPEDISEESKGNNYYCNIKCTKEFPYELIETQTCVQNCSISQINNKICKINYISENKTDKNTAQEKMVNDIKEEITNGIDTSTIDKGEDIVIEAKDVTITITKNSNQKNEINTKSNKTSIDLGDCEVKLKERYNIPKNESLYILKMDVKQEGYNIPKIQYEVYYPLKNDSKLYLLNLSVCKDININIYLPMSLNGSLDRIDPNSNFYNDICTTYTSENGTDLTLAERKKNYINNNLTVCEENCDFIGYNETTEKAICSCKVKTNFISKISENILNKEELYKSFTNFKNIFNIKVIKCIHLIFSVKAFKENYANIILISIILLFIFCLIIFVCKYYEKGIKFYVDIIIYFTLFYENVSNTIKKQKKKVRLIILIFLY